jgi:hypothetical protein
VYEGWRAERQAPGAIGTLEDGRQRAVVMVVVVVVVVEVLLLLLLLCRVYFSGEKSSQVAGRPWVSSHMPLLHCIVPASTSHILHSTPDVASAFPLLPWLIPMLFEKCTITIAAMHHHLSSYSANAARLSPFISSRSAANAWAVSRQSSALLPPSPTLPLAARRQPYRLLIYACTRASFTQTPPSAPNLPPPSPTPLPLLLIIMIASYSRLLLSASPQAGVRHVLCHFCPVVGRGSEPQCFALIPNAHITDAAMKPAANAMSCTKSPRHTLRPPVGCTPAQLWIAMQKDAPLSTHHMCWLQTQRKLTILFGALTNSFQTALSQGGTRTP